MEQTRRLTPDSLAAWITVLAIGGAAYHAATEIVDLWYHLLVGKYITDFGAIPRTGFGVIGYENQAFVYHEWLAQLVMYLAYKFAGGLEGLRLLRVVLITLFALLFWKLTRLRVRNPLTVLIWLPLLVFALTPFLSDRPQLFSLVLFTTVLYCLAKYSQTGHRKVLLWLPPIFLFWANVHGLWLLGLALTGIFYLEECWQNGRTSKARDYFLALLAGGAAGTLNPFGTEVFLLPFRVSYASSMVTEWYSPLYLINYNLSIGLKYLLLVVLIVLSLLLSRLPKRRDMLLAGVSLGLFLWSFRHLLFLLPILGYAVLPHFEQVFKSLLDRINLEDRRWQALAIVIVLAFVIPKVTSVAESRYTPPPQGVLEPIVLSNQAKIFTNNFWADYILFAANSQQWKPGVTVFQDTRLELISRQSMEHYREILTGGPRALELLDLYRVDTVVAIPSEGIFRLLYGNPKYLLVRQEEDFHLFVRNTGRYNY